jgi:epoxyqueuosine reductase
MFKGAAYMELNFEMIRDITRGYTENSPENKVAELDNLTLFESPLVAVAKASDPLFDGLKETAVVGPNHLSPREWLEGAQTVISYFLPFTFKVREANRISGLPAIEWLYGRIEGEQFNRSLSDYLVKYLTDNGYRALAPGRDRRFSIANRRSNWSERHVAYIAGLGTFSLSRSLITRCGSAGRIGSVISDLPLEPTLRDYKAIDEYCSKCGACILRCPPLAITEAGKDNTVCGEYLDRVLARFKPRYGCGKCQTKVSCEAKIPLTRMQN